MAMLLIGKWLCYCFEHQAELCLILEWLIVYSKTGNPNLEYEEIKHINIFKEIKSSRLNICIMDQLKTIINSISQIPDDEYELIIPIINRIDVKKNTNLLTQGQICKYVYFVESGFFRMFYVDYEGNEINCRFAQENEFMVDFQSFLTQKPAKYSWRTMQDSKVIALRYGDIHRLYDQSQAWEKFGRLIAEHVYQQINEREEMLHFQSPEQRYQTLLDTQPDLFNRVSQYHLSSYIGIKPESLSRLRKRLLRR